MNLVYCTTVILITVSLASALADESKLPRATVMGLRLGDTYEKVCAETDMENWTGMIGNPRFRDKGTMKSLPPGAKEPYDAQLDPPAGTKYLGGDLTGLNLYFDFQEGSFRLFAISFKVDGPVSGVNDRGEAVTVPLERILTKQFGPMNTGSGWAVGNAMLLLQGNEVLLFDVTRRSAAEIWYYQNAKDFSSQE